MEVNRWKLTVGLGENVWIDNLETVTIQDNVCISQGAFLFFVKSQFLNLLVLI